MTDEEAMLAYRHGDEAAFQILFERHQGRVMSYIRKRLSNEEQQNEVFQDAFMKLHRSRELYDPEQAFVKWLYVITRTVLADSKRAFAKRNEVPVEEEKLELMINELGDEKKPDIDLSQLNEEQRLAVEMRYELGEDFDVIAKKLGKTESAVRKLISRSIKKLREFYK